jgi:methyl-accepting chemotaxis protein
MEEILQSIRHVNDIIGDITMASNEQLTGVEQISEAITQVDHVTQQNAALVEQAASAASALQSQAGQLVDMVSLFKLEHRPLPAIAA